MSVVRSQRSTSGMEFVNTARNLAKATMVFCANHLPKKYTFYLGQELCQNAMAVHRCVVRANEIYPKGPNEVWERRRLFLEAYGSLGVLDSLLSMIPDTVPVKASSLEEISGMIISEKKLVRGMLERDEKRFKNLANQ